jgi:hypothetical protein
VSLALRARSIGVLVSPGALLERIATREVEAERAEDEAVRRGALVDLAYHVALCNGTVTASPTLDALAAELKAAIAAGRAVEDQIRECERGADSGPRFIERARIMTSAGERGAELRRRIDALVDARAEVELIAASAATG